MPARALEKNLSRSLKIDREKIDDKERKLELAFSSENPVERWGENEVLSHNKGDYDFSRLNDSHPLLLGHAEHDPKSQIGVIESARVDGDKVGRAIVRFGNSQLATEIYNDVKDGIRKLVSVGYDRTGIVESQKAKDGMVTTRYRWEPTHIAIVPVPADLKTGVGRSKKRQCADCEGTGNCPECEGTGEGDGDEDDRCMRCGGSGRCDDCRGNGYFTSAKSKTPIDLESMTEADKSALRKKLMADKTTIEINEADIRKDERANASKETATAERARSKEITIAADKFIEKHGRKNNSKAADEIRKFASEAIEKGDAPNVFNSRCMEYVINAEPESVDVRNLVPAEELAEFSVMRVLQQCITNGEKSNGRGMPDEKSLEGQVIKAYSDECRKADGGMGFTPSGFVLPPHVPIGRASMSRQEARSEFRKLQNRFGRDMQANVFGAGGAVVPTYWLLPVIELLRNKMVLPRLGVRTLAGLTGNVIIPRLAAPSTAYSVAEIAAVTASQETLDQITLTPHRVSGQVVYSKQLVFQSSPDIEALIRDDMMMVHAIKHDQLGLNGQGAASEPLGILNTPGINTVTFGAAATYAKIVSFETQIRSNNVMGRLAYASTSKTKGVLKTTAVALTGATVVASGEQNALWHARVDGDGMEDGVMNGCQAVDSQQIPLDLVLAGVFDNFIHGMFGGFDIVVDPYTKAGQAEWVVTMNTWIDFAARHVQAFSVSTDAGSQ